MLLLNANRVSTFRSHDYFEEVQSAQSLYFKVWNDAERGDR